jgi:uncharacterized protein YjbI with pentapeptide repeats
MPNASPAVQDPLCRLAGKSVLMQGKFNALERKRLAAMALAQRGTVASGYNPGVRYVVVPDAAAVITHRKKAATFNKKGASIEVLEAPAFRSLFAPTPEELLALVHLGPVGAARLKALVGDAAYYEELGGRDRLPPHVTISGQSFDGLDLSGFDFTGLAFEDCRFTRTTLNGTRIHSAIACDFSRATGKGTDFEKVDRSRFTHARFTSSEFRSHFDGIDLSNATLDSCILSEHFWASAINRKGDKAGARFTGASLRGTHFDGLTLHEPSFRNADLTDAAFARCNMAGADFAGAKLGGTLLVACDLPGATFRNAKLTGTNLAEADLKRTTFAGASLTSCNVRGATLTGSDLKANPGYQTAWAAARTAGPSLRKLDALATKARQMKFAFIAGETAARPVEVEFTVYGGRGKNSAYLYLPTLEGRLEPRPLGSKPLVDELAQAARVLGHLPVRLETVRITQKGAKTDAKALHALAVAAVAEAFGQPAPDAVTLAKASRAYGKLRRERVAAAKAERAKSKARQQAEEQAQKGQNLKRIQQNIGKVSDTASFLHALGLRIGSPKIKKATSMLKTSKFQLFHDITPDHLAGVVKSQTAPDLVYACRLDHDGHYACCTQNLNACGGLRGSLCKHLLVLVIGLVQGGALDPETVDAWVAASADRKPDFNRDALGEIFLKYKGAEAGEVDWRPTETMPEDYYSL